MYTCITLQPLLVKKIETEEALKIFHAPLFKLWDVHTLNHILVYGKYFHTDPNLPTGLELETLRLWQNKLPNQILPTWERKATLPEPCKYVYMVQAIFPSLHTKRHILNTEVGSRVLIRTGELSWKPKWVGDQNLTWRLVFHGFVWCWRKSLLIYLVWEVEVECSCSSSDSRRKPSFRAAALICPDQPKQPTPALVAKNIFLLYDTRSLKEPSYAPTNPPPHLLQKIFSFLWY